MSTYKPAALCILRKDLIDILREVVPAFAKTAKDIDGGGIRYLSNGESNLFQQLLEERRNLLWFGPRHHIETDERFLQLLPYCLVKHKESGFVVGYNRPGKGEGESRLQGAFSIGLGGHVEIPDFRGSRKKTIGELLLRAADREIAEELAVEPTNGWDMSGPIGVILDNTNPVGRVHLGLIYQLEISNLPDCPGVHPGPSSEIEDPHWIRMTERIHKKAEPWTRLILEAARPHEV